MKSPSPSLLRLGAVSLVLLAGGIESSSAQTTYYWDGNGAATGSGSTTLVGNWGGGSASAYWGTVAAGTSATTAATLTSLDTAVFAANDGSGTGNNYNGTYTVTLGAAQSVLGITIAAQTVGLGNSGGTLTLAGTGSPGLTIGSGGVTLNGSNGDPVFAASLGTITLGADQTWTINNAHVWTINAAVAGNAGTGATRTWTMGYVNAFTPTVTGVISDGSGGGNLALMVNNTNGATTGGGTHSITGTANTFTGATTIARGTLQIASLKNVGGGASSLGAVTTVGNGTINLGSGANTGTLIYNGAAASSSDRVINLAGTTGGGGLANNSASAANTLTLTSNLTNPSGVKTLTLRGTNTGTNTISGVIADALDASKLSVTKSEAGQWVLGASNTYSGGTTISAGTLSVNSTGTLGANVAGNNVTISGGNLLFSSASNIGSNQTLTVNSGGIGVSYTPVSLPTITDNTGATGGVYGINYSGTGGVTSQANGSLYNGNWFLGSFTSGTYTGSSLGAGNSSSYRLGGGGGTLTIQNNVLSGANNLIVGGTGGGTVILAGNNNTYSGNTTIQAGTLSFAAGASLGTSSNAIALGATTAVVGLNYTGAGETINRAINFTGTTGAVTLSNSGTGSVVYAGAPTYTTGVRAWVFGNTTDSFGGTLGTVGTAPSGLVTANVSTVTVNGLSNSAWNLTGGDTYAGNTTITGGVLSAPTIGGVSTELASTYISLNGSATHFAVLQANGSLSRTLSTTASSSNLNWGANGGFAAKGGTLTLNFNSGASLTWNTGGFMASGTTPMVLGSTSADSQLILQNGIDFGTATAGFNRYIDVEGIAATIVGGASGNGISGSSALISGPLTSTLGSGNNGFVKTGSGTLVLTGTNTYTGGTTIGNGTLVLGSASALGTAPTITLGAGNANGSDGTNATGGSPTLLLGGALSSSAPITISNITTTGTYGIGGSTTNSATLSGTITASQSFAVTQVAGGTLNLTGNITGGATALVKTVNFKNTGTVNAGTGIISDGAGGGKLAVIQSGSGTTNLTSANTYSGSTTISGGILNAGSLANFNTASAIGKGSVTNTASDLVLDGGTLQYTGTTAASTNRAYTLTTNGGSFDASGTSTGAVTYSGNMTASGTTGGQTLNLTGTGTGTAGGTIGGTINNGTGSNVTSLTKSGTGLWTLSGANTYTGVTTITGGTLALSAASNNITNSSSIIVGDTAAHSSATLNVTGVTGGFTVNSGKTLAGHGTIVGNTTFASGSILSPGNSAGTTTFNGNLTLSSGTSLVFDLATTGTSDKVLLSSGNLLTLNNQSITDFTFTLLSGYGAGTYTLIDASAGSILGSLNSNPANLTEVLGGFNATLSLNSSNLILTVAVVPEPGTWAMMLGGLVMLVVIQRRRAKQV